MRGLSGDDVVVLGFAGGGFSSLVFRLLVRLIRLLSGVWRVCYVASLVECFLTRVLLVVGVMGAGNGGRMVRCCNAM